MQWHCDRDRDCDCDCDPSPSKSTVSTLFLHLTSLHLDSNLSSPDPPPSGSLKTLQSRPPIPLIPPLSCPVDVLPKYTTLSAQRNRGTLTPELRLPPPPSFSLLAPDSHHWTK